MTAVAASSIYGSALAQDSGSANAKSGVPTIVGSIGQVDSVTCEPAGLQGRIVTPPANGTVSLERRTARNQNHRSACFGKPAEVQAIVYRSRPGFRGTDMVKVGILVFNGRTDVLHDVTITVNVQ